MEHQVQSVPTMLESHITASICALASLFLLHLHVNVPRKTTDDGSITWISFHPSGRPSWGSQLLASTSSE